MASIFELPILFVCENNYYSIFTHIKDRQPSDNMTRFAKAHHIKSLRTNGYDLNNVDKKSKYAISEIKKNRRPFLFNLIIIDFSSIVDQTMTIIKITDQSLSKNYGSLKIRLNYYIMNLLEKNY